MNKIIVWANKRSKRFWRWLFIVPKISMIILGIVIVPLFNAFFFEKEPQFHEYQSSAVSDPDWVYAYFGLIDMSLGEYLIIFSIVLFVSSLMWSCYNRLQPYEKGLKYIDGEWSW